MRRMRARTRWLGSVLLGLAGCYSTQPNLQPPKHPEEYVVPPADGPRFSNPVSFPKDTLNKELPKKDRQGMPGMPPTGGPSRFGTPGGY